MKADFEICRRVKGDRVKWESKIVRAETIQEARKLADVWASELVESQVQILSYGGKVFNQN